MPFKMPFSRYSKPKSIHPPKIAGGLVQELPTPLRKLDTGERMARLDPQASDLTNQNAAKKRLILRETGVGVQLARPAACWLCSGLLDPKTGP